LKGRKGKTVLLLSNTKERLFTFPSLPPNGTRVNYDIDNVTILMSLLSFLITQVMENFINLKFYLYNTSCTLRAMLRLQFNLNETRYFVLIVFIEELLNIQYCLFFLLVCTRINRKVFQRVSASHIQLSM
jgi:hypothetical protein